jgi:kynurenine formamidase
LKETSTNPAVLSNVEFEEIFRSVSNWGRWGAEDERGTLNYITPDHVRAAARLVRSGRSVSLSLPLNMVAGPDNPRPSVHHVVKMYDLPLSARGEPQFAGDFLGTEIHGDSRTHVDALCHVAYKGRIYNGRPTSIVTSRGATRQDITAYVNGIVGRGVLLDIPRLYGAKWLEPGQAVTIEELERAEKTQGVELREGDIFLFRTGHHRRRLELGAWDNSYEGEGQAGLHPSTMSFLHERKVAAFFPDGDGETVPSNVEGVAYPIHALQIAAMGMACADSLQFEDLVKDAESENRWEFMVVACPLFLRGGTGSPFNPIAIL